MKKYLCINRSLRHLLAKEIQTAVDKQHGCIGTMYKNKGVRYGVYEESEGVPESYPYQEAPIFPIKHSGDFVQRYEAYEGVVCWDIYNTYNKICYATVHGVSGEDIEINICSLPIEGLMAIRQWLVDHDFIEPFKNDPYRCEHCGTTDIRDYYNLNTNKGYVLDLEECIGGDPPYCCRCDGETSTIRESELLPRIDKWWEWSGFDIRAKYSGLNKSDYYSEGGQEKFMADTDKWWAKQSAKDKIKHWNENK